MSATKTKTKKELASETRATRRLEREVREHAAGLNEWIEWCDERWFDHDAQDYEPETPAEVRVLVAAHLAHSQALFSPSTETLTAYADAHVLAQRAYATLLLADAENSARSMRGLAASLGPFPPAPWQIHPENDDYVYREDTQAYKLVADLKAELCMK